MDTFDFVLRPLGEDDTPALQRLYEAAPRTLARWLGSGAQPGQAERDTAQARATPGRYQFAALLGGELVGMVDCKLAADVPGQAHIGLLLFSDPFAGSEVAALALRILTRWLVTSFGVYRLATSVPAQAADEIAFWQRQGFVFTGEQFRRRTSPQHVPRFLVLAQDLTEMKEEPPTQPHNI